MPAYYPPSASQLTGTLADSQLPSTVNLVSNLPIFSCWITTNQAIGNWQKCIMFGSVTIVSGCVTISSGGQMVILNLPGGLQ